MLHTNERIIKHKVGLLNLAEELGNELQSLPGHGPVAGHFLPIQTGR